MENLSGSLQTLSVGTEKRFPVKSIQFAALIEEKHTEFIIDFFADQIFVVITQTGKLGTIFEVAKDQSEDSEEPSFSVKTLLGKRDDTLLTIYARQIVEAISKTTNVSKSVILALGVHPPPTKEKVTLAAILKILKSNKL